MLEAKRPNLFILLDLDPDEQYSVEELRTRLEEKCRQFSRDVDRSGATAQKAKLALDHKAVLEKLLNPDKDFEDEKQDARDEREAKRKRKQDEFFAVVKMASLRGFVFEIEVQQWKQDYADALSVREIEQAIDVPRRNTPDDKTSLDLTTSRQIREDLDLFGIDSLYGLLQSPESATKDQLLQNARTLQRETRTAMNKTAEVDANSRLAGHAVTIFDDDAQRERYDTTLRHERFRRLTKPYHSVWSADKLILEEQVRAVLEQVEAHNWMSREQAKEELALLARENSWAILYPAAPAEAAATSPARDEEIRKEKEKSRQLQRQLSDALRKQAAVDEELRNLRNQRDQRVSDNQKLQRELDEKERERLQYQRDMERARRRLAAQQAQEDDRIRNRLNEREREIEQHLHDSDVFAAKRVLESVSPRPASWTGYASTIAQRISKAETWLKSAKASGDPLRAEELCRKAMDEVADFEEAGRWLASQPPAPPRRLQASAHGATVELAWEASGSSGVRYIVVRSVKSPVRTPTDGENLAELDDVTFTDQSAPIGAHLHYGVFACRGNRYSLHDAITSEPLLLLPEVDEITKQIDDGKVTLAWTPPRGVAKVVVTRGTNGSPAARQSGDLVSAIGNSRVCDEHLTNGREYFYTIRCVYRTADGTESLSDGVVISAIPSTPPHQVPILTIQEEDSYYGQRIRFLAAAPATGDLYILKCEGSSAPDARSTLPEAGVSTFGRRISAKDPDVLLGTCAVTYVPIVIHEETAYVGTPVQYAWVQDLEKVTVENSGDVLCLRWTWPRGTTSAAISDAVEGYTGPTSQMIIVPRKPGDVAGQYDLVGEAHQEHVITLKARATFNGRVVTSHGVTRTTWLGGHIIIRYEFQRYTRLLGSRQWKLILHAAGASRLPALVVRMKTGMPPSDKQDGILVDVLRGIDASTSPVEHSLALPSNGPDWYGAVFLEDDQQDQYVEVHPVSTEGQRVT